MPAVYILQLGYREEDAGSQRQALRAATYLYCAIDEKTGGGTAGGGTAGDEKAGDGRADDGRAGDERAGDERAESG